MEKEHTQSVVERAYAFVEDMFGLKHDDTTQLSEPGPRITPGLTSDHPDPDAYTFQTVGELHVESRRRADGE